jgi:hypothetical protein
MRLWQGWWKWKTPDDIPKLTSGTGKLTGIAEDKVLIVPQRPKGLRGQRPNSGGEWDGDRAKNTENETDYSKGVVWPEAITRKWDADCYNLALTRALSRSEDLWAKGRREAIWRLAESLKSWERQVGEMRLGMRIFLNGALQRKLGHCDGMQGVPRKVTALWSTEYGVPR